MTSGAATGPWGTDVADVDTWLSAGCVPPRDGLVPADLPPVAWFVQSRFIPLVRHTLARCLDEAGRPDGAGVGMVLASVLGDTTTADLASAAVAIGRKPQPLLFYQSVPNSVVGHVATEYGITGPLTCLAGGAELYDDAVETVELMFADGVDRVLLAYAELGTGRRPADSMRALDTWSGEPLVAGWECCTAVLLTESDCADLIAAGTRLNDHSSAALLPRPVRSFLALTTASMPREPAR
ncbi:hypothetical protein [Actinokineospora sp.]|uniref:hypothetical protein n=1 Tax=Actinokineospora sp. TaxID=1872133 RepID=UPI0040379D02